MSGKVKDRTGEKHYRLTFVQPTNRRDKRGAAIWELLCECGKTTFALAKDVTRGNTTSCGCYAAERRSIVGMNNRKYDPVISSARIVWSGEYKDCDFETFFELSQKLCYYCNRAPQKVFNVGSSTRKSNGYRSHHQMTNGNFTYNGLDRIDSSKGHTPDNIVPCCTRCNQAKNDMSTDEFLDLVKRIYETKCKD